MGSNDFFANQPHLGVPDVYDLCFIDGLHLSDQALRDFIHIEERASHESTVVVMDDVLPGRPDIAKRDRPPSGPWAGDVWKVPYLLIRERSDLTVDIVDVPPAGLAIISGLSPGTSFWDTEDAIVSRMEAYPFAEALGFLESFAIQPDRAYFQRLGQGPTHSPSILLSRIRRHLRRVRPERLVRKLKS